MHKKVLPYGSWPSSLNTKDLASHADKISFPKIVGGKLYYLERRSADKGRVQIVCDNIDLLPDGYSARSKVHEYGGDCYIVVKDRVYFTNDKDQRIYYLKDGKVYPFTRKDNMRYIGGVFDSSRELFYYIQEEHLPDDVINRIISIDLEGKERVVAEGHDFYLSLALDPEGKSLAYLAWNHPHMPWDSTYLYLHTMKQDGSLEDGIKIKGGEKESIFSPKFSPDGDLYFVSDETGYWNIYRYQDKKSLNLYPTERECGYPMWISGQSTYDFIQSDEGYDLIFTSLEAGEAKLSYLSLQSFEVRDFEVDFTSMADLSVTDSAILFMGASPTSFERVTSFNVKEEKITYHTKEPSFALSKEEISVGQKITFTNEEGELSYGYFYPPLHKECIGKESERAPLIIKVHGGPTAFSPNVLDPNIQFWTSRGFSYGIVNYGGSTGFGRAYRERLNGKWGICDVNDAASFALHLVHEGLVDRDRLAIKGSSSGGYSALAALTFRDVFSAGISLYGIADLELLAKETHKFEKHYTDSLIAPYPEGKAVYHKRSPIHFIKKIKGALLLFHGKKDFVVPYEQSLQIHEKMTKEGKDSNLVLFDEEGHGFRRAESLVKMLEEELAFYKRVFRC